MKTLKREKKNDFINNKKGKQKFIQFNRILLVIFLILNIYVLFVILKLKSKVAQIFDFLTSSTIANKNNNNSLIRSINNMIKIDENEKINDGFLEECVKQQNDFCDYPNKYLNPDYEDLITLTNFDFKNLSYQLYVYWKNDKYKSNEIIRTAKYEPGPMSQFLETL